MTSQTRTHDAPVVARVETLLEPALTIERDDIGVLASLCQRTHDVRVRVSNITHGTQTEMTRNSKAQRTRTFEQSRDVDAQIDSLLLVRDVAGRSIRRAEV